MAQRREQFAKRAAERGRYSPLYWHLAGTKGTDWRVSFSEIEAILGFTLPDSARLHRRWWTNQPRGGGHSHSLAWQAAGWKTSEVDLAAETLVFARDEGAGPQARQADATRPFDLDRDFPAVDMGPWPEGFAVRREEICDDRGRLSGRPDAKLQERRC